MTHAISHTYFGISAISYGSSNHYKLELDTVTGRESSVLCLVNLTIMSGLQ